LSEIFIQSSAVNNTFKNIQIASYPTNISFIYDSSPFSGWIRIYGVDSPHQDPSGWRNISKYVRITNSSGLSWLWLNISYSDSDITNAGINESSLKIWKYNGSDWIESGWNGSRILDTDNNIVGVNITSFSVFAPFGQIIPSVYFVPENIAVPGYCNTTTASIWVNTSVALGAGQLIFYYDPTCMNVTEYAGNNSNWNAINNANLQYGFVEIGFANTYPTGVGPGSIHIGDITVHCVDAGSCCGTLIYWNTTNSYLQDMDTNKIYPVLNNGTFICGQLLKVNKTVWNGTAWVDQLQLPSSWIGKDVIFKITVSATCEDLEDVIINDVMSQGLKYNDAASLVPTSSSAHSVDWTLALLPAGTSQSITFNATITGYGTQTDTANVTATVTNLGVRVQAQDDASVSVIPSLNITVNKTVWDPNSGKWVEGINDAKIGDTYRFKCVITNTGSFDLTNITVWDILSPSMEYADDAVLTTPGRIKYNIDPPTNITTLPDGSTMVNWTIDDYLLSPLTLKPGQSLTIEFNATVINYGNDTNTQFAKGWSPAVNAWAVDNDTAYINTPKSDIVVSDITINYDASNVKNKAIGPLPPGNKTQCNNISATISELNGVDVGFRFNVKFEVNGTKLNCSPVHVPAGALKGGGSVTVYCDCSFYPIAGETYNISVIADSDNEISESDETNNIRWKNVTAIWNGWKGNGWQDGREISTSQCHQGRINLVYSTGDSYYLSGAASPNWTTYEANWTPSDFNIPQASSIVDARLYVYYSYDKTPDGDPTNTSDGYYVNLTFNGYLKTHIAHYSDREGFGSYNYPYGMIVYNVTSEFSSTGSNKAILNYTWPSGAYEQLSIDGMLLVVVYNHSSEPKRIIWINDGFDLIYAKTSYAVSSEEATAYVRFNGCGPISLGNVIDAKLITVAPHASDGDDFNRLYFNGHVWKGIWAGYAGSTQLGINETDVSGYLKATDNIALFQSHIPTGATKGNHMVASNAFLVVELTNTPPTHSKPFIGAHINPSMNGLVSYWQFEYDNGTHTFDATGRNNGTLHGGVKLVHEGKVGKAYEFDGVNDYITADSVTADLANKNISIAFWLKSSDVSSNQSFFISFNNNTGGAHKLLIGRNTGSNKLAIDNGTTRKTSSTVIIDDTWHFVTIIFDTTSNNIMVYIDSNYDFSVPCTNDISSTDKFSIGMEWDGSNPSDYFNGTIDEVMILNRILSESEIKDLYDLTKGKYALTNNDIGCSPNSTSDADNDNYTYIYNWYRNNQSILVLNMPFEGGSNSTYTKDYSSFGNDGTVHGASWNSTGGHDGSGAYEFDGVDDYIEVPLTPSLNLSEYVTVSFWVKFKDFPPSGCHDNLVTTRRGNITTGPWRGPIFIEIKNRSSDNQTILKFRIGNNTNSTTLRSITTLSLNKWYFLTFVAKNKEFLKIYIDGKLDIQNSTTQNWENFSFWRFGFLWKNNALNGTMDEVMIFNRSLSESEIKALYERGLNTIVAEETSPGEEWKCSVTLNDGIENSTTLESSSISVLEKKKPKEEVEEEVKPRARRPRGCFERWNCTEWGPCINGTQTRICYDIGTCNRSPRTETRSCVIPQKPAPKPELKIKKEKPLPPAKPCKPPIIILILIAAMFAHLSYCSIKLRQAPTEKEKRKYFDYTFGDTLAIVALIVLAYILCPISIENIVILTIASLAAIVTIIWAGYEAYKLPAKRLKPERQLIVVPEKKLKKRLEKERMLAEIERKELAKARKTIAKALKRKLSHEEELKQRLAQEERALLEPEKVLLKKIEKEKRKLKKQKKRIKKIERELKEKLRAEAAAIIEPEKRLHKLLALEKARRVKALKKAFEERRKELKRIKRHEAYERRKRLLEEKAELRRKLEEKIHKISHTLNEFILKAIARGLHKQKIKTLLINAGWNEKFIERYVDEFYKLNAGAIIRLRRKRHKQIEKGIFQLIDEIKEELKHPSIEKHYPVKIGKKKKKEITKTKKAPKINKHKADEKSLIFIERINKLIDHIDEELEKLKKF